MTDESGQGAADLPNREQRCVMAVATALEWIGEHQRGEPKSTIVTRLEKLFRSALDGSMPAQAMTEFVRDHE